MILLWSNLVLTSQLLSLFLWLGNPWAFAALSLGLAACAVPLLRWLQPSPESFGEGLPSKFAPMRYENRVIPILLASGAIVLACNLLIAGTHLASNPDTIVYRFPRIYWYLTQGSFAHFAYGSDPRVIYYPTNGTTLYIPLVLYRFGALWFNLPTLLAWCTIPLITYAFARDLGAVRGWAVAAGWAVALTPNVLIQALSTNDEILAAASLLAGLLFLHRWSRGGRPLDLLLGSAGVCLSVGTKLHVFFYWPYILVLLLAALFSWRRCLQLLRGLWNRRGVATVLACALLAVVLGLSFIVYNLRATGQITELDFARLVLNAPLNLAVSAQTIVVYALQIALSPFPDILPNAGYGRARAPLYAAFNALFQPMMGWVSNGPAFTSVGYRFTGIVSDTAFLLNEQTVMIGFSWLAALIAAAWLALHRRLASPWALWIALSLPAWFVGWAASTKYIEGIPVYVAYAAIVSAPAWAFALAPIKSVFWSRARWGAIWMILATHVMLAVSVLTLNTSRSVSAIFVGKGPLPRSVAFMVEQSVTDELALAKGGITHHTLDWGQPNWVFMAFNPQIPQKLLSIPTIYRETLAERDARTDAENDARALAFSRDIRMPQQNDPTLHIYSIRQAPAFGHAALRVSRKSTPGLTKIGEINFFFGRESVFAAGNGVEVRHPDSTGYVVFTFNEVSNFGHDPKPVLELQPVVLGLGRDDDLAFRSALTIGGNIVDQTEWGPTPRAKFSTMGLDADNGILTIMVRNNKAGGHIDTIKVKLRSVKPAEPNS